MRNWYYYCWLSGDHIVEQAVHGLDTMGWVMGDKPPVRCWGVGGRQSRTDPKYGNIWDHFSIVYEYPEQRPRLPPVPPLGQHGQPGQGLHPGHQGHGRRLRQFHHRREQWRYRESEGERRSTCTRSSTTRCSPPSAPASRSTTAKQAASEHVAGLDGPHGRLHRPGHHAGSDPELQARPDPSQVRVRPARHASHSGPRHHQVRVSVAGVISICRTLAQGRQ